MTGAGQLQITEIAAQATPGDKLPSVVAVNTDVFGAVDHKERHRKIKRVGPEVDLPQRFEHRAPQKHRASRFRYDTLGSQLALNLVGVIARPHRPARSDGRT